jgi:hypothetical protein
VQLGNPEIDRRNRAAADAHSEGLRAVVAPLAGLTTRTIAAALNERGIRTARGGRWQSMTVIRLLDRLGCNNQAGFESST